MIVQKWFLICAVLLLAAGCVTPVTTPEFNSWIAEQSCVQSGAGRIVFRGNSGNDLGACLDGAQAQTIRELRITSAGGDAWETLQVAQRYAGRIDAVIVDHLCGSSCADYILPSAKRIVVRPRTFIMLHGSIDPKAIADYVNAQRPIQERLHPEFPKEQVDQALDRALAEADAQAAIQTTFEQARLSCAEWLHPVDYFSPGYEGAKLPPEAAEYAKWLLVTPSMAARCLKQTRIVSFWSPPEQDDLPAPLLSQQALRAP